MILSLEEIQRPISTDLQVFETKFRDSMKTRVVLLDKIMTYIVKRKGKQIRPMFVFLAAHLSGGVTEGTFRGAALIELVHTASLVHDDVIDDANMRRGFFSINALWKNKIAVLVGDYLLSKGLLLSCKYKDYNLLEILADTVREMSEGELLQMEKARRLDITEETYFEIIRQKTATLISSCCGVGAASSGADQNVIDKLSLFGEKVGLAFQIKDDLFDYSTSKVIGKPVGIDIKEKKMTLPLIYALQNCGWWEKRKIINIVKNESHKDRKVQEVIDFVKASGGLEYSSTVMEKYISEATEILSFFPDSVYKQSLLQLVKFTIERSK